MDESVKNYLRTIGAKGGKISQRSLSRTAAQEMVRVREARRAFRKFQVECFWSFDPSTVIRYSDIPWVVAQLRKNGGRAAWLIAEKLCH